MTCYLYGFGKQEDNPESIAGSRVQEGFCWSRSVHNDAFGSTRYVVCMPVDHCTVTAAEPCVEWPRLAVFLGVRVVWLLLPAALLNQRVRMGMCASKMCIVALKSVCWPMPTKMYCCYALQCQHCNHWTVSV